MTGADQINLALLVVRLFFGVGLAYHGYNKVFGSGGLAGTTRWFGSIGMRWPHWQARAAATTEMGAGLLFAAGLITPFAAAGMIGVMVVAGWASHRKNGFFVFKDGWEFTASIGVAAWAVATIGPGRFSLDAAFGITLDGWTGALVAGLLGVGGGVAQLALSYRPGARTSAPA